jgi:hypothetical protein
MAWERPTAQVRLVARAAGRPTRHARATHGARFCGAGAAHLQPAASRRRAAKSRGRSAPAGPSGPGAGPPRPAPTPFGRRGGAQALTPPQPRPKCAGSGGEVTPMRNQQGKAGGPPAVPNANRKANQTKPDQTKPNQNRAHLGLLLGARPLCGVVAVHRPLQRGRRGAAGEPQVKVGNLVGWGWVACLRPACLCA